EGDRLYTMYRPAGLLSAVRRSQEEVVIALDASTGKTIWEYRYAAPTDGVDFSQGAGPHSTPLIIGNTLYATSSRRELFAIDKATGKLRWSHDFIKEYGAPGPGRGYTCSPLAFGDNVIVTVAAPVNWSRRSTSRAARWCGAAATAKRRRRRPFSSTSTASGSSSSSAAIASSA